MASMAKGLVVSGVDKELPVAAVGLDVVYIGGLDTA